MKKPDPFLNISQTEARTGINRKTLRRWWQHEPAKFPKPVKYSERLFWRESWVDEWMLDVERCA